jgi:hypothetical protein
MKKISVYCSSGKNPWRNLEEESDFDVVIKQMNRKCLVDGELRNALAPPHQSTPCLMTTYNWASVTFSAKNMFQCTIIVRIPIILRAIW